MSDDARQASRAASCWRSVAAALLQLGYRADAPHVVYRLIDAEQYHGQRVLLVGGGDSAIEAALSIASAGASAVSLSYRGDAFQRAKRANRERIEAARASSTVGVWLGSTVREIGKGVVRLGTSSGDQPVPADTVIVCAGGVLPTEFLRSIGIELETKNGTPSLTRTIHERPATNAFTDGSSRPSPSSRLDVASTSSATPVGAANLHRYRRSRYGLHE